jgi:hypothetical protein
MGEGTVWYGRRAGEFDGPGPHAVPIADGPEEAARGEHGAALLMGANLSIPDRCIVPRDSPVDARREVRILDHFVAQCRHPACADSPHDVRVFIAERGWFIGECPRTGFAWMRLS